MEDFLQKLESTDDAIHLDFRPFEIKTLRLRK
jgi:hypothetical protein